MGTVLAIIGVVIVYAIALGGYWVACELLRDRSDNMPGGIVVVPAATGVLIFGVATIVSFGLLAGAM